MGLSKSYFDLEKEVEDFIFKTPDLENIFGEDLFIIGHQVEFVGIDDKLDFLAISKSGDMVVIETKKSYLRATDCISQVIRYASYASLFSLLDIKELAESHYYIQTNKRVNFEKQIEKFLDVDISNINQNQKIFLIGADSNKKLNSSCRWLNEQGVDIELISIEKFKSELDGQEYVKINTIDSAKEIEAFPPKIKNDFSKAHHLKSSEKEIKELTEVFVETIQDLYEFDGPIWDRQTFAYFTVKDKHVLDFKVNKTNIYVEIRNIFLYDNPVDKNQLISILEEKLDFSVEERISFKF